MSQPFAGLRVVDFTQVIAGPYATLQLAALGADVVKIEQPRGGDQGRQMLAPTDAARQHGMSALFSSVNSAKRSLTLDLKHPQAAPVVHRLVAGADVVVENFKAGTMHRLGFGYDALREINARLVYCAISGYGQGGPRASAAAYDPVVQATSGMMSINGYDETGPTKVGFWVVDMTTGLSAAFAIASALFRRAQTGAGEYIDVAMLDTAVSLLSPLVGLYQNFGVEPPFTGNGTPGVGGGSTVYPAGDGAFLTVAAATDAQFAALVTEIGHPEMARDPRFSSRQGRLANAVAYREAVTEGLAADSAAAWEARLARIGVPASKNLSIRELGDDAQLRHREVFQRLPAPEGIEGDTFTAVSLGFKLGHGGPRLDAAPPAVGAHSNEVLAELGYSAAEIATLRGQGVV